jgi:alcohol dehydrogenase (cytochrome c)
LRLQVTPVVVDGVMYVTSANECYALDAGNGREIWRFQQPRTKASSAMRRVASIEGSRLLASACFMVTDHAHLLALNRFTATCCGYRDGGLAAELQRHVGAVDRRRFSSLRARPGGEQGVRGFLAAYDQTTGKEAWRFWTVPKPGEPGSETWKGAGIEQPAARLDDRRLRCRARPGVTGPQAIQVPTTTVTIGSETTSMRAPSSRSTREAGA